MTGLLHAVVDRSIDRLESWLNGSVSPGDTLQLSAAAIMKAIGSAAKKYRPRCLFCRGLMALHRMTRPTCAPANHRYEGFTEFRDGKPVRRWRRCLKCGACASVA